jgi:hypothetical protein
MTTQVARQAAARASRPAFPPAFRSWPRGSQRPMTGYLAAEVLNAWPPAARDVLLSTSILEQASAEAARELTGNGRAARGDAPRAHHPCVTSRHAGLRGVRAESPILRLTRAADAGHYRRARPGRRTRNGCGQLTPSGGSV